MARLDYFLIWHHGFQYKYRILSIIRADFKITGIYKRNIAPIENFVRDIYACDTVPFKHLISKTRYLLKLKPEIIFVLIENEAPESAIVGHGAFRHEQCMRIKAVKTEIRQQFNPMNTEHHVVHASDYESQTKHALRLLNIRVVKNKKRKTITRKVRIDDLLANIIDKGLVRITETPHYKYLTGKKSAYLEYYDKYLGTRLTDDHTPEAFDDLIKGFEYENDIVISGDKIIDGVHRAAILKKNGINEIKVRDANI